MIPWIVLCEEHDKKVTHPRHRDNSILNNMGRSEGIYFYRKLYSVSLTQIWVPKPTLMTWVKPDQGSRQGGKVDKLRHMENMSGAGVHSQCLLVCSQLSVASVPDYLMLSSDLHGYHTYTWCIDIDASNQTPIHIESIINRKIKKQMCLDAPYLKYLGKHLHC